MYLDFNYLMSFDALFTLVNAERGVGKTYGFKKHAINNFIKNRKKFVYVRRFESELQEINTFFDDILLKERRLQEHEFKVKDNRFLMDGAEIGFYLPLTKAQQFKSMPFVDYDLILFDEYIIDDNTHHYIANEINIFYNLCETIFRMNDFKAFLFGNSANLLNPYNIHFDFFDLPYSKNHLWNKKLDAVYIYAQNKAYQDYKSHTRFGRAVKSTNYGKFAIENKFYGDNADMVEKKKDCFYFCSIKLKEATLHFYKSNRLNRLYASSKKLNYDNIKLYSFYADDYSFDVTITRSIKTNYHLKNILFAIRDSKLYYDDIKAKRLFKPYLKFFI